ncbi:hypothetical protein HYV83_04125 [Candidatus Woesearchaeota archaeon]|nr:hypothetical protein [Candidatus Woesearchaeota archaeon]
MRHQFVIVAVLLALLLAGCASPEKGSVKEPAQQQVIASAPVAAVVDNTTNFTEEKGCSYNNPACNASYDCISNSCLLKSGCSYSNPSCDSNHSCTSNMCVLKEGCRYKNPPCNSSQICQNNKCFEHILSSGGGGY